MSVPPVEPAPLTPPPDAGRPPRGRPRGSRRSARTRKIRAWQVTLILATAALIAVALVVAVPRLESKGPRPESKGHPGAGAVEPGGAVPAGNLPGWRLTYSTDFNGNSLPDGWSAYTGEPGGDPYGYWDPANVTVSNGALHLRTTANNDPQRPDTYSTGGVGFYGGTQENGMYLIRMKGDYEPGLKISNIVLLWPAEQDVWPPEIDFYEDGGGNRSGYTASLHPGPDGNDCCVIRHSHEITGTQWHTYGVIWTPVSITYTIDGKPWAKVQQSEVSSPGSWPATPMTLDLQSQNVGPAQPGGSIETMTVAWVAEYAPRS
jgi:beta-glucanase (GH16 family)